MISLDIILNLISIDVKMPRYTLECNKCLKVTERILKVAEMDIIRIDSPKCLDCNKGKLKQVILSCPQMLVPFNMKTESQWSGKAKKDAIEKYYGYTKGPHD